MSLLYRRKPSTIRSFVCAVRISIRLSCWYRSQSYQFLSSFQNTANNDHYSKHIPTTSNAACMQTDTAQLVINHSGVRFAPTSLGSTRIHHQCDRVGRPIHVEDIDVVVSVFEPLGVFQVRCVTLHRSTRLPCVINNWVSRRPTDKPTFGPSSPQNT